ncbi:MAG: hypothetical protein V1649_03200 [Patescibacteria group bacterium]
MKKLPDNQIAFYQSPDGSVNIENHHLEIKNDRGAANFNRISKMRRGGRGDIWLSMKWLVI